MKKQLLIIGIVAILVSVGLSGCTSTENIQPIYKMYKRVHVSSDNFSSEWPLTVDSGYIECYQESDSNGGGNAWFFRTETADGGGLFYYNSISSKMALNYGLDCNSIEYIWKRDPRCVDYPCYVSIGELSDFALDFLNSPP
jgi:hypothetical protein